MERVVLRSPLSLEAMWDGWDRVMEDRRRADSKVSCVVGVLV